MKDSLVAQEYGQVIFEASGSAVDAVIDFFTAIASAMQEVSSLEVFLNHPAIGMGEKEKMLYLLAPKGVPDTMRFVMSVLVRKKHMHLIPEIAHVLAELKSARSGFKKVQVISAFPLEEQDRKRLLDRLGTLLGKRVIPAFSVDSTLISGLRITIDDTVIDNTIHHFLREVERQFHASM